MPDSLLDHAFGPGPAALPLIIGAICGGGGADPDPAHCGPGGPTAPAAWYAWGWTSVGIGACPGEAPLACPLRSSCSRVLMWGLLGSSSAARWYASRASATWLLHDSYWRPDSQ